MEENILREWADDYEFVMRRIYSLESRNYDYGADSSFFHNGNKELDKEKADRLSEHMKKAVNYLLAKDGFNDESKDVLLDILNSLKGYKTKKDFSLFHIRLRDSLGI